VQFRVKNARSLGDPFQTEAAFLALRCGLARNKTATIVLDAQPDIADIALFLASSAADYITGDVFAVNGGAFAGRMYLPLQTAATR